jgi:hypothetical protein
MVTIADYSRRQNSEGKEFMALILQEEMNPSLSQSVP